jgi:hypothetical protein
MKRLAALLAAVTIVGWASPAPADELTGKVFYAFIFDKDGDYIEYGFLEFWENEHGELKLDHRWRSDNGRVWTADRVHWDDYGDYGFEWDAKPEDQWRKDVDQNAPYDEFDAFYCRPWDQLIGHAYAYPEGGPDEMYSLYGWQYTW